jgi:hypothetical protein
MLSGTLVLRAWNQRWSFPAPVTPLQLAQETFFARKGSAFPTGTLYTNLPRWGCASLSMKPTISRDTPCLSITSVAHDRLPVFGKDALKKMACAALDGFAIFAYVLMPDHLHVMTDGEKGGGTPIFPLGWSFQRAADHQ